MFKVSKLAMLMLVLVLAISLVAGCGGAQNKGQVGEDGQLSGVLDINGSTTVAPVIQAWAEAFNDLHPDLDVVVTGTGSGNGIAALINGTTDIAMASRKMKSAEREQIKGTPVEYTVAKDGLAVIVHPDNTVASMTMEQIKDVFTGKITNWQELGGDDVQILIYTRDTSSGTYGFFKEFVLEDEEYTEASRRTASNAAMANTIAQEQYSIGYVGLPFLTDKVKAVAVGKAGGEPVTPSVEKAISGEYPIVRDMDVYTVGEAEGLAKAFLDFGFSAEGQALVKEVGYVPVK